MNSLSYSSINSLSGNSLSGSFLLRFLLLAALFGSLFSCRSLADRELIVERRDVVLFQIPADQYPSEDIRLELREVETFPALDLKQIAVLLKNLRYRHKGAWWDRNQYIFYNEEIEELSLFLSEGLRKLLKSHRLEVISRYDPDRSLIGRPELTSFLIWKDKREINLVFGNIREPLVQDDLVFEQEIWHEVTPVNMYMSPPHLRVLLPKGFRYKTILGNVHYSWLVFPAESLKSLPEERPSLQKDASSPSSKPDATAKSAPAAKTLPDRSLQNQGEENGQDKKKGSVNEPSQPSVKQSTSDRPASAPVLPATEESPEKSLENRASSNEKTGKDEKKGKKPKKTDK